MQADLRIPKGFILYQKGSIFSNFDNRLDYNVACWIEGKDYYAEFTAYNFLALGWWNDQLGYWCVEIWQSSLFQNTYMAENLKALIEEVQYIYGFD